jgi:hypothetical protein
VWKSSYILPVVGFVRPNFAGVGFLGYMFGFVGFKLCFILLTVFLVSGNPHAEAVSVRIYLHESNAPKVSLKPASTVEPNRSASTVEQKPLQNRTEQQTQQNRRATK